MSNKFLFTTQLRNINDLDMKYSYLKFIPGGIKLFLLKLFPIKYKIFPLLRYKEIKGYLLVFFYTSKQIITNKNYFSRLFLIIIKKLKNKINFSIVGLGSFTSVVSHGGMDYNNSINGVSFTNGNALTTYITFKHLLQIADFSDRKKNIAIIGANGSIGSAITALIDQSERFGNIIGIVRNNNSNVLDNYNLDNIFISSNITDISSYDIIVMCTSSKEVLLDKIDLKVGVIIYDITQPSNISSSIKNRDSVKVITGGLLELGPNLKLDIDLGFGKNIVYGCLGETILLSMFNYNQDFSLGHVTLDKVNKIGDMLNQSELKIKKIKL